jgi:hypothetical protein
MPKIKLKRGLEANLPVLDIGEPGFTTDTGKMFVGGTTGNVGFAQQSIVDGLSSSVEKKVQKGDLSINPKDYGAAGDGVSDDTSALQSAFNAGMANGVPVLLGNKVYKTTSTLTGGSNLHLIGNGAKIDYRFIPKTYSSGVATVENHALDILGSFGTKVSLTSDAVEMAQSIVVADASGFAPDDWVQIVSEDFYPYSGTFVIPRGEIKQIRSISGNTITFTTVMWEGYTVANSAACRKMNFVENIYVSGIRFIGSNANQLTTNNREVGIALYAAKNFHIERCGFYGQDFVGVRVRSSILGSVVHNDIKGAFRVSDLSKGTVYYGIAVQNNAQWVYVGQNKGATLRRLGVCTATQTDYGQAYHIIFQGNQFRDSHSGSTGRVEGFEHHGFGRWISFDANQTDSSLGGVRIEGRDVSVTNNIFTNCVGSGIVFDDDAGVFENILIANNHVTRAVEDGTSSVGYGIEIQLAPNNRNRNIVVRDNLIHGWASSSRTGIRVIKQPLATAKNCHIIGNTIDSGKDTTDTTGMGAWIESSNWDLTDNHFYGYAQGIRMSIECDGNILSNNHFSNPDISASTNGAITVYGPNIKSIRNIFKDCNIAHRAISSATNMKLHDSVYINVTTPLSNAGTGTVETAAQVL